ncbi:MAG: ketopantoate reductase family protein [Novosphingobium sp.]|uniref:ketopantoate reductase family protein n=1 Tax=Novosphingobium sp. NDB2Meth1 TaxID=1892847 RepID=UPI000931B3FA|nr:ketopantoate reductase family protein [Novosphingobium sp. NDB2Meth1]MBY0393912.1 ketopantoate reductase family protein [Novosphingobium sp.]
MISKIAIVGAGAMGCFLAARLAKGGLDVTVIDVDRARLEVIGREGITLHDDNGTATAKVRACLAVELAGPVDLVLLMTKGMFSAAAIRSVAHLAQHNPLVLTLQNGLGNVEAIAEVFHADHVLWGVTDFPADLEGPAQVSSHGDGHIWLGGVNERAHAHAEALAEALNKGALNVAIDPEVRVSVWEKVAFNAALNPLATITGLPVGGLDCPEGRRIATAVAQETIATATALGVPIDPARVLAKIDFALANHKAHKPSMLQDRLAGRRTEIESINGAIVRMAEQADVATPTTRMLADLVRMGEPRG